MAPPYLEAYVVLLSETEAHVHEQLKEQTGATDEPEGKGRKKKKSRERIFKSC